MLKGLLANQTSARLHTARRSCCRPAWNTQLHGAAGTVPHTPNILWLTATAETEALQCLLPQLVFSALVLSASSELWPQVEETEA